MIRSTIQTSRQAESRESDPKLAADSRSTLFSKSANPQKSAIRKPFKAKSVDPQTYSPPFVQSNFITPAQIQH